MPRVLISALQHSISRFARITDVFPSNINMRMFPQSLAFGFAHTDIKYCIRLYRYSCTDYCTINGRLDMISYFVYLRQGWVVQHRARNFSPQIAQQAAELIVFQRTWSPSVGTHRTSCAASNTHWASTATGRCAAALHVMMYA